MTTRGIRNNNPLNMEPGGWNGEIGNDGRFAIFDTMANGIRAPCKNFIVYHDKYGIDTVRGIVNRWAPPSENDTENYIHFVCHILTLQPDDHMDMRSPDTLFWLITAMGEMENGADNFTAGVSDADIDAGIAAALA